MTEESDVISLCRRLVKATDERDAYKSLLGDERGFSRRISGLLTLAQKDKARLDWLESEGYPSFERWSTGWGLDVHDHATLRDAIDAAMEAR